MAKTSGSATDRTEMRQVKEVSSLDEQLRQFKNLRSSLYQWIAAQNLLETSFSTQKEAA